MRCFFLIVFVALVGQVGADQCWLDRRLSIEGDYGYFRRTGLRDLPLVRDVLPLQPPRDVLDTEDLIDKENLQPAIGGEIILYIDRCVSIGGGYTYFYPWHHTRKVSAPGTLQFPFDDLIDVTDYKEANKVTATYKSHMQTGDFLLWWHVTPQRVNYFAFSWNIGLRGFYLEESFQLSFQRGQSVSDYRTRTRNVLGGGQIGALLEVNPSCRWGWKASIKGAALLNRARGRLSIRDLDDTMLLRAYTRKKWVGGYLVEGDGQVNYLISSFITLSFGYQAIFVQNLALAPEQRQRHPIGGDSQLRGRGHLLVDGFYASLDLHF